MTPASTLTASCMREAVPLAGRVRVPRREHQGHPGAGREGFAICETCGGPAREGRRACWSCAVAAGQLGWLPRVVPVFLFGLGSPVHRALVGYKAGVSDGGRLARQGALTGVLGSFLEAHAACLLGDRTEALVVPVPSSAGGRPSWGGQHPVELVAGGAVAGLPQLSLQAVLRPATLPPARLQASAGGFLVDDPGQVRGATVLVVDDVFVSGSRPMSAAAALARAGARVAAVVPLGRLVRPDHNAATAAYWRALGRRAFDPSVCVLCDPERHSASRAATVCPFAHPAGTVSTRLAA